MRYGDEERVRFSAEKGVAGLVGIEWGSRRLAWAGGARDSRQYLGRSTTATASRPERSHEEVNQENCDHVRRN